MKIIATRKEDQNESWIDPWSAVHGATGLAFGLTGISFWKSVAVAVAYDVLEQIFERSPHGQRFFNTSGPETWGNVIFDLLLFIGGWHLGADYNATGTATNPKRRNPHTPRPPRPRAAKASNPAPRGARKRVAASHVSRANAVAGTIRSR